MATQHFCYTDILRVQNQLTVLSMDKSGREASFHSKILKSLGVQVSQVENGSEAINFCRLGKGYDIIAINMDLDDGPQIVVSLRQMGVRSKLIGFTRQGKERIVEFLHAGLDFCLKKPVEPDGLAAVVERIDDDY